MTSTLASTGGEASPAAELAIETVGLTKTFGSHRAVDSIDLSIPAGSVYAILGPNGAGKTTLVRMLATLVRPSSGSARIFGYDVQSDATAVRSLIGLTGQYASVDDELTALENLRIFARLLGFSRKQAKATAGDLLEEFGLSEAADRSVKGFSGGMRRRLDLAASMISRPPLIFLDEPTTGLDPRTRAQMWDTVRRLVDGGSTVLLTTQYLEEADVLADRIAVIDRGRVVANGTADDLKAAVGTSALHLTVADPSRTAEAALIVSWYGPDDVAAATDSGRLNVPIKDTAMVTEILMSLRAAGIDFAEIGVHKPSLDEVFFALTGGAPNTTEPEQGEVAPAASSIPKQDAE